MRFPQRLLVPLVAALSVTGAAVPALASAQPVIGLPTSSAYTENSGAVALAPTATLTYSSGTTLTGATVQIIGNFTTFEDALDLPVTAVTPSPISGSFDSGTGTLTLTGTASVADYETALQAITYANALDSPSTATRTVRFTALDGGTSGSADMTITVTAVNDPPILAGFGGTVTFTENGSAVTIAGASTLADPDDANLTSATVSITGNFATGEDVLSVATPGGLTTSYDATLGVLTLSGVASKATYRTALRSVRYSTASDAPSTGQRTVKFRIKDAAAWSAEGTAWVNVVATDDAPIVTTGGGSVGFTEAAGPVAVDPALTVADVDSATLASATVQVTGNFTAGEDHLSFSNTSAVTYGNVVASFNPGTGVLTMASAGATATVAQWQAALRAVGYVNSSQAPSTATRTVSFTVNDGTANSSPATRSITVTAVATPPTVATTTGPTAFTEDAGPVAVDPGVTVQDPDSPVTTATVAIVTGFTQGQDVLALPAQASGITGAYDPTTGALTLSAAGGATLAQWVAALQSVTYDSPSQAPVTTTRHVAFTAGDGAGTSDPAHKPVSVANVADDPSLTLSGVPLVAAGGVATQVDAELIVADPDVTGITAAEVSVAVGFAGAQDVLAFAPDGSTTGNVSGTYDAATGVLSLTSTGGTATVAQWQAALRAVTYRNAADVPDARARTLQVRLRDGDGRAWVAATRPLQVTAPARPSGEAAAPATASGTQPGGGSAGAAPMALDARTPKRLTVTIRVHDGVAVTTGRVPPGVDRVLQSAERLAGATAKSSASRGRPGLTGSCTVATSRAPFTCRIALGPGRWRLTTRAVGPAGTVAVSKSVLRVVRPRAVTG